MVLICPICKNSHPLVIYSCSEFNLLKCNQCGLVLKSYEKKLEREDVQCLQDHVYSDLSRKDMSIVRTMALERFNLIKSLNKKGFLLEIGCATGEFLEVAEHSNFKTFGLEASEIYATYAMLKGLNIKYGRLEDFDSLDTIFDVVAMFHVFEHIERPNEFLKLLKLYMAKNGMLMLIVPNLESITNKFFGFQHPVFHQPDHLFFYSKKTLSNLLANNGFEVTSIRSREYPHHPFSSLKCYLAKYLKNEVKTKSFILNGDTLNIATKCSYMGFNCKCPDGLRVRNLLKKHVKNIPYFLGILLYPIIRIYGRIIEKNIKGHELIVFARKQ